MRNKSKKKKHNKNSTQHKSDYNHTQYLEESHNSVFQILHDFEYARKEGSEVLKKYLLGLNEFTFQKIQECLTGEEIDLISKERETFDSQDIKKNSKDFWKWVVSTETDLKENGNGRMALDRHIDTKYTYSDSIASAVLASLHNDFRGDKIITMEVKELDGEKRIHTFSITENVIGNCMLDFDMFITFFESLMNSGGVILVRHFPSLKIQQNDLSENILCDICKDVYALRVEEGGLIIQVTPETLRKDSAVEEDTDQYIGVETEIVYKAWPSLSIPFAGTV